MTEFADYALTIAIKDIKFEPFSATIAILVLESSKKISKSCKKPWITSNFMRDNS